MVEPFTMIWLLAALAWAVKSIVVARIAVEKICESFICVILFDVTCYVWSVKCCVFELYF